MNENIDELIVKTPIISPMISLSQINILLNYLDTAIESGVEGDVVEFGCNCGTTSVFLQNYLEGTNRKLYIYDSFEGLPRKDKKDLCKEGAHLTQGSCKTSQEYLENNLKQYCITQPTVYKSWFKDIPDDKLPEKIAFAFFDGDFYSSIMDSFEKVYDRMSVGGYILIHDYEYPPLPGVKKACDDFLKGKPEEGTIVMVDCIGIMRKL